MELHVLRLGETDEIVGAVVIGAEVLVMNLMASRYGAVEMLPDVSVEQGLGLGRLAVVGPMSMEGSLGVASVLLT